MKSAHHPIRRRATLVSAILAASTAAAASSGTAVAAAAPADSPSTTVLSSEVVTRLSTMTDMGTVADGTKMRIAVALQTNTSAIDAAYKAMFDSSSATYHQFLTPTQYRQDFGVDPATAASVRKAVIAQGLSVVYSAPDSSYIELTGSAAEVEKTFDVSEHTYRAGASDKPFTANDKAPTVPAGVTAVTGLTSLTNKTLADTAAATKAPSQSSCGTVAGSCIGTLTAQDLWSIYDEPDSDMGQGQRIGIFGEGELDTIVSDLRHYEADRKLPDGSAFPTVPVRRVLVGDDLTDSAGDGEWDLDSDATTGMSPKLQELSYYFGSDLSDASIGGTYSAWANETNGPLIGNSSFGGPEQLEYLSGFILNPILEQAAMEGRTMFASSGDGGSSCLPGLNGLTNAAVPCVEYPASSPYAVGVGGTVLYAAAGVVSNTETVPATRSNEYSWTYSGGGQANFEGAPDYQAADFPLSAAVVGTKAYAAVPCAAGPSAGMPCRGVPDVSAVSGDSVSNGYEVYSGGETQSGGTSLSSPLWAGMWARVIAAHASSCSNTYAGSTIGFAQPVLYKVAGTGGTSDTDSFFDVGGTTNSVPVAGNGAQVALPRSPADPTGYDYVSGLGTPILGGIMKYVDCGNTTPVAANMPEAADTTIMPSPTNCGPNGVLTPADPAGDELPAVDTALDITTATISSDSASTTFAMQVTNLAGLPGIASDYTFEFTFGNVRYAVSADSGATDTFELEQRNVVDVDVENAELPPTNLAAITGSFNTATNTVSITMPWSALNTAASAAAAAATPPVSFVPFGPGSVVVSPVIYTNVGAAAVAIPEDYQGVLVDQAEYFTCTYKVPAIATAAASLPEAPYAALLPLVALAGGGLLLVARKRRDA